MQSNARTPWPHHAHGSLNPKEPVAAGSFPNDAPERALQTPGDGTAPPEESMQTHPIILVCDHRGDGTSAWVRGLSNAGYRIESTLNLRQSLLAIGRLEPAVLIVDPLARGGEIELDAIQRTVQGEQDPPEAPAVPVLLVADGDDPRPTVRGARGLGVDLIDLVHRDAPLEEFLMRIKGLQARQRMHQETLAEMRDLQHRATHDHHTDLLRPDAFEGRLGETFSAAKRHGHPMALLLIDLDKFGEINKRHNHLVGNRVIVEVGRAIEAALRQEDIAGRLGGDEFGVILPFTRKLQAAIVVQRLLRAIRDLSGEFKGSNGPIHMGGSIGFQTFDGSDVDSVETLRLHCERALRRAKLGGGNLGVYFRDIGDDISEQ